MGQEPELKNTNSLQKEFQNLLDKDFKDRKLKENEIIKATVTEITKNFVVVDCKAKMEGMIPIEEFKNDDEINFNKEDLKLIDANAQKIISEFRDNIKEISNFTRENLEPIVQELIKSNNTNFKGVGQPLRVALTGSKFGPGIYDIIISLGKEEVEKRLSNKTIS